MNLMPISSAMLLMMEDRQSLELHPEDLLQLGGGNAVVHVNEVVCFFYHFSVPYGV